ncbi:MAG TPA: TonB-dependent receptor [Steroidobacter sp.]|uniref:TonB-dependent receptor n=1 Tax=Steroidobacter sp. TaxID=1978227 RepID=UPI002EDBA4EC
MRSILMGLLGLSVGGVAQAQQSDTAAATNDNVTLEEVIVTSQKREESIQSVPVSVSVMTGAQLDALKLDDASSLVTQVPNLQVNGIVGEASPVFSLRGVSMFDYSLNQSSPVAAYVDEVYKGNFAIFGVELFDLERVEVLRGPQGTLYGKNTTGGAINFITRKPGFTTEGYARLGTGNYGRMDAEGAVQGALVPDRLAVRIAATYASADGWFNGVNGTPDMNAVDQYGVRLGMLFQPTDSLDLLLRYSTSRQNPRNYGILARPGPDGVGAGVYAAFNALDPVANPHLDYFRAGLANDEIETSYHPKRKQDTDAVSLTLNWSLSDTVELTSISSWDKGKLHNLEDTDGSPLRAAEIPYIGETEQFAQDLRLTSTGESRFNYIVGVYYSNEQIFNSTELRLFNDIDVNLDGQLNALDCLEGGLDLGGVSCRFANQFDQQRDSWAIYTDTSYQISEPLTFRLGLRYTADEGRQKNFSAQLRGNDGVPLANLIPGDPDNLDATARRSLSDSKVTGRVGFDYVTASDNLLYVSYSSGYRSGAFNAQAFFDSSELTVVEPESVDSYEVGMKSQWFGNRLQANLAIFHFTYENQQVIDIDPITLAQPLRNLGKAEVDGAELEFVLRASRDVTLRGGVGLMDAKLKRATMRGEDVSGNKLPNAPSVTATLSADWLAVSWGAADLTLHADAGYSGSQYFEAFNVDRIRQDAYTLLNARIAVGAPDRQWEIAGWARNLTDEFYITSAADLLSGFGFDYTHRGAPRTYGIEATYRF